MADGGFREAVEVCGFADLGYIGLPYTWDNRQQGRSNVKVRLDRGLANAKFLNLFQSVKVWHVQTTQSDHCCLVVEGLKGSNSRNHKRRAFQYENMWRRDPSYRQVVNSVCYNSDRPSTLNQLSAQLGSISSSLSSWEKNSFGSVKKEMSLLRSELESIRRSSLHSGPSRRERFLMSKISELLSREEIMMKQRSRIAWLQEGDRNTAFFHAKARERAQSNRILALKKEDGSIVTSQEALETEAMDFYSKLFTRQEDLDPGPILNCVQEKVTGHMNESLMKPFTAEEVRHEGESLRNHAETWFQRRLCLSSNEVCHICFLFNQS